MSGHLLWNDPADTYVINICWFLSGLWLLKWMCMNICGQRVHSNLNHKFCEDLSELRIGSGPTYGIIVVDEENRFIPQIKHLRYRELYLPPNLLSNYANVAFNFIHMFPVRYWHGMEGEGAVHCMGLYLIDNLNHNDWKKSPDQRRIYSPRWFKKDYGLIYVVYANKCESIDYLHKV
eukprot:346322_1